MAEGGREMRLPRLRLAMTEKKLPTTSPFVIARSISDEAIPKLNPKLEALNPKQILISIVNHKTIYNFACFFRNVKSPLVPLF
jgi:hypothetical protein